jgi:hypothetical protein
MLMSQEQKTSPSNSPERLSDILLVINKIDKVFGRMTA